MPYTLRKADAEGAAARQVGEPFRGWVLEVGKDGDRAVDVATDSMFGVESVATASSAS
jgi:hypothetical protein